MTATTAAAVPDRLTLGAFAAVAVIGGGNSIAVKQSVVELAPFWSAGTRFLAAGLILGGFVLVTRRPFPSGSSVTALPECLPVEECRAAVA